MTAKQSELARVKLAKRVHPTKVKLPNPKAHALVAWLLNERGWTRPEILSAAVTNDGFLIGHISEGQRHEGGEWFGDFALVAEQALMLCAEVKAKASEVAWLKERLAGLARQGGARLDLDRIIANLKQEGRVLCAR